ncbi:MAG: hypothetical protein GC147_10665 [Porphyrobacter sp.]|nr:hypothetical protein [Porphyrobacter sp.]
MAGLCACAASDARYPSLAMRPFETAPPGTAPTAPAEPTRPLADAEALRLLVAKALEADHAFARQRALAVPLVAAAAGLPVESDARAAALLAMADLSAKRGVTTAALADLDRLVAESAAVFAPKQDIETARGTVAALVDGQDAAMARLWKDMGQ